MIIEVLSALSVGDALAGDIAAFAWKGMRTIHPRGYGAGYSHLGGVADGLRR